MEIIGHRGARGLALENTIESIRAGLASGVDMIEVDLRLDEHHEVVLAHDPVVFDIDFTTLEEVLDRIGNTFSLNVEIKEQDVVYKLKPLLENYAGRLVVSSYSAKTLQAVHTELPNVELAVLEKWSSVRAAYKARVVKTKRIHMNHRFLWSGVVKSLKKRGYSVFAYTVNTKQRMSMLSQWGVDGIFTDHPERFITPKASKKPGSQKRD